MAGRWLGRAAVGDGRAGAGPGIFGEVVHTSICAYSDGDGAAADECGDLLASWRAAAGAVGGGRVGVAAGGVGCLWL